MWDNPRWRAAIVVLFPMLSILGGLTVALSARQQIRRGALAWREPYLPGLLLFQLLVLLPLGLYLFVSFPAWSMLYLTGAGDVGFMMGAGLIIGCLLLATGAYQLGYLLCRRRRDRLASGLVVLVVIGFALLFGLFGDRFARLSPDEAWENAPGILGTPLGTVFAFMTPVVLGGWIFLLVLFGVEGKKVRRARVGTVGSETFGDYQPVGTTAAYPASASQDGMPSPSIQSQKISPSPSGSSSPGASRPDASGQPAKPAPGE